MSKHRHQVHNMFTWIIQYSEFKKQNIKFISGCVPVQVELVCYALHSRERTQTLDSSDSSGPGPLPIYKIQSFNQYLIIYNPGKYLPIVETLRTLTWFVWQRTVGSVSLGAGFLWWHSCLDWSPGLIFGQPHPTLCAKDIPLSIINARP